jgi:soluble lytic murein transglycosylase-like protein
MRKLILLLSFAVAAPSAAQSRAEAEYYADAYATHYGVPRDFLRALITQESNWQPCARSSKGAAGLMQLMPATAAFMGVKDPCDVRQNLSAGVRHLSYLLDRFHGDLRLVAAAYYAGERAIANCRLACSNREVVAYVDGIRTRVGGRSERSKASRTWRRP